MHSKRRYHVQKLFIDIFRATCNRNRIALSKLKSTANYTRDKVYSHKETQIAINDILADLSGLFTDEKVTIKGKTKEQAIGILWQGLNTVQGKDRQAFAEKVADY